jgi:drug/metabolite transporter (DMT)-like permease
MDDHQPVSLPVTAFAAANLVFATAANILLKLSADASTTLMFLFYQAAGNLLGLAGILAYTGLLRRLPLHIAFPLTQGLAAVAISAVGSRLVFRETFTAREAAGCAIVMLGVVLIGASAPRKRETG